MSRNVLLQADSSRVSRYRYRYRYRCGYRYRYRYSHRYRYRYRLRYKPKGFPRGPGRLPKGAQEEGRGAYPQRLRKRAAGDTPFGAPRKAPEGPQKAHLGAKKLPKKLWGTVKLTMRDARSRKQIWSPVSRNVLLQSDSFPVSRNALL